MYRRYVRPIKEIELQDLDDSFIKLETWDPYFWEKVTHVVTTSWEEDGALCSHFDYYMKVNEVWGRLTEGKGYIYILTTDQQEGLCKIGCTERTPEERLAEINRGTGVIFDWKLYDAFPCRAPRSVEKLVHKALSEARINPKKEGFAVYPEVAQGIISKVIESNAEEFKLTNRQESNIA